RGPNLGNSCQYHEKAALGDQLTGPLVFESNMMPFRVDSSKVLPEFAFYFLASPDGRTELTKRAKRAVAQSSINQSDVLSVRLPLAPLEEQGRICLALMAMSRKVEA